MKRRDFLKFFAAAPAALAIPAVPALSAKPLEIAVDPAIPGEDKTCEVIWGDDRIQQIYELGRTLDQADVPKRDRFVHETVIDPTTFKRVTRVRKIS